MIGTRVLVLAAGLILTPAPALAYFDDIDIGARAQGMGTAGAAMIDDVTSFAWNPAALDRLERPEAMAAYGLPLGVKRLYSGALAVGGPGPGPFGSLGMAVAWRRYGVEGVYSEDLWQVSAGRTAWRHSAGHEIAVGGTLKVGRVGFSEYEDPDTGAPVEYGSRTRMSVDTAALWRSPWRVNVAWTTSDWTSPDYNFIEGEGGSDVPTRHRLSASYRWHGESTVGAAWTSSGARGGGRVDLGVEIWFFDVFAIRSGLTDVGGLPDPGTSAQRFQYAGGIGLRDERWRLDAAVATTRELGTSYRFSLVVPFGRARVAQATMPGGEP